MEWPITDPYGQPQPQGGNMPVTGAGGASPMAGALGPEAMGGMGGVPQNGMGALDPAKVQAILALQAQQGKRTGVNKQLALADQLRADANSQLSGRRVGVANVVGSIANNYAAKSQMDKANAAGSKLDDERVSAIKDYFGMMGGGGV